MHSKFEEDRLLFVKQLELYLQQQMLPEALSMAEERLSRLPLDADALVFMHLALIEMGKLEETGNVLGALEKETARLSLIYLRIADNYRKKGLNSDAVDCYQKCLVLNPHSEYSAEIAEKVAFLRKEKTLTAEIEEAEGPDMPKPEFYTVTLAELYIKQGHLKMAETVLTEMMKRNPLNAQAGEKLAAVKAAIARKSRPDEDHTAADDVIKTLSYWLANIGRLKKHAP